MIQMLIKQQEERGHEQRRWRDLRHIYLKNLQRELDIGREIQAGFLPKELPRLDGWEMAAFFKAAREVAGDFYDAFLLPDGNLVCLVGDVCDKGVGAALFMALFRSLIRATTLNYFDCSREEKSTPVSLNRLQQVITSTNQYITSTHADAKFAALFMGIIDPPSGNLSYLNCGIEPPLLIGSGNKNVPLPANSPVVGVFSDAVFSPTKVVMEKGDNLVIFTDGVTDALDINNNPFGRENILKNIPKGELSPDELLKTCMEGLKQFVGEADQYDDITLLAIKRNI
jgi:phosphoserine phosphatase RsbU/P